MEIVGGCFNVLPNQLAWQCLIEESTNVGCQKKCDENEAATAFRKENISESTEF